jgi:hypothetical protein
LRRQRDCLAVYRDGRSVDEIAVRRILSDGAAGLQVRKEEPQRGHLATDRRILEPGRLGRVAPSGDVHRPDIG